MKEITAPYGFVPLNEKVVCPDWIQPRAEASETYVAPPVQDVPFEDGICGALELEIEAETPIFTRGADEGGETFFTLPDGQFALPGTMLKGAIRNVVEIASFGHLGGRVNDHRYAVRDLQNRDLYGNHMADIVQDPRTRKREPMPLVNAGILRRVKNSDGEVSHSIEVRDFAKIEYQKLEEIAGTRGLREFRPGSKQSSVSKYQAWGGASREVTVSVSWTRPQWVNDRLMPSRFGKVDTIRGEEKGILVFTGQPSRWTPDRSGGRRRGSAKHHDFVFLPAATPADFIVEKRVFRDFEFAHSDRGQQNRLGRSETPNEEWGYWEKKLAQGKDVPVFFLATNDGKGIKAFGLAMMFRLPYKFSVLDAVKHGQRDYDVEGPRFDLADGLFGVVRKIEKQSAALALKSRVDFTHAVAVGGDVRPDAQVRAVLGAPKASYYPNYVEQTPGTPGTNPPRDRSGKARYTTWQDDECRPRGWKRYRPMTEVWNPEPPTGADGRELPLDKVRTTFRPLPAGTRFRGKVYLHNVRPVELGALLWSLDFGGDEKARHTLGMARPLGHGRCRIRISGTAGLTDVLGGAVDLEACRRAFGKYMAEQVPGWVETAAMRELIALARPVAPSHAAYQRLDPGQRTNEFVDAKKQGLALPSAHAGPRPAPEGARGPAAEGRMNRSGPPGRQERGPGGYQGGRGGRGQGGYRGSRGGTPGTGRGAPLSAARAAWPGKKRGDTLQVELTELNKKGKWRSKVIGYDAKGTIEGSPPSDAAEGKQYEVEVIQGSDPRNLNLKWKES